MPCKSFNAIFFLSWLKGTYDIYVCTVKKLVNLESIYFCVIMCFISTTANDDCSNLIESKIFHTDFQSIQCKFSNTLIDHLNKVFSY